MCRLVFVLLHIHSSEVENVEGKLKKSGKSACDLQVSVDAESDVSESRRKSPIPRWKRHSHVSTHGSGTILILAGTTPFRFFIATNDGIRLHTCSHKFGHTFGIPDELPPEYERQERQCHKEQRREVLDAPLDAVLCSRLVWQLIQRVRSCSFCSRGRQFLPSFPPTTSKDKQRWSSGHLKNLWHWPDRKQKYCVVWSSEWVFIAVPRVPQNKKFLS